LIFGHSYAFRFGKLKLHGHIRVGKDRRAWQELDCYLFSDMLICVKERKATYNNPVDPGEEPRRPKCTLKGSILIKKHLQSVETSAGRIHALL
jgi:Pleckstrin homology domain